MKRAVFIILFMMLAGFIFAQVVNGDTLKIEDKLILRIWGTHFERGYAYGYLLGERIKEVAEEYVIGYVFSSSSYLYSNFRSYVESHFEIEDKYLSETSAMMDGMQDAEVDIYSSVLGRDLDHIDIIAANCLVDMSSMNMFSANVEFGCSSLSSWGESTLSDPVLLGNPIITRNMDWTANNTLLRNHLLIVQYPSEEDEVSWLSFTFPGMIGALSAVNENGIASFMNMGNVDTVVNEDSLHPIFLSIRNGIELNDYDENSFSNQYDIYQSITDRIHLSGSIVHCLNDEFGIVVECNNSDGTVLRNEDNNTEIPQNNLAATNHFRLLYEPVYCYRYDNIVDSLAIDTNVTVERSWELLGGAAGVSSNLHTIQYAPSLDLIRWSTAKIGHPAYTLPPTSFDLEELFSLTEAENVVIPDQVELIGIFPNPAITGRKISFLCNDGSSIHRIEIYNSNGQKIKELQIGNYEAGLNKISWNGKDENDHQVASGVYFARIKTGLSEFNRKIVLMNK